MTERPIRVQIHVDPVCPFAWLATSWLLEVERQRPVDLRIDLMSLWMLNERRQVEPDYRRLLDRTRGPARVAAAAKAEHGDGVLRGVYLAMAAEIFQPAHREIVQRPRSDVGAWSAMVDHSVSAALVACGLPAELAAAASSSRHDAALRASHETGLRAVGRGVGTPIVRLGGSAFFGPVLTAVPRGPDATRLFDCLLALTADSHFVELRRPITGPLDVDSAA